MVFLYGHAALASSSDRFHHGAGRVAEASGVYRPRHPERGLFYQIFERHFDRYLGPPPAEPASPPNGPPGSRTGSWARVLRRVPEVDPLLCAHCGVEMKIVSVITEPQVVDAILRSLARGACRDPFAERAPPAPAVGETASTQ